MARDQRQRAARRGVWLAATLVGLSGLLVGARYVGPARDIPAGTGYAAHDLCSRTMHMGQPLERVREDYVAPKVRQLPYFWQIDYRAGEAVRVSTWLPTLERARTAIYREGLGCTMLPPGAPSPERLRSQPFARAAAVSTSDAPWPYGGGRPNRDPLPEGWGAILERHERIIFDRTPGDDASTHTTALLVAHRGHLIHETYGDGLAREQPQLGWSMTKTLTALVAGTLVGAEKLSLDAPVGLPRWAGTDKAAITWRQLLNMAPGLEWSEGYGGKSHATDMLFSRADQAAYAADLPLVSKPGTTFMYSTGTSNIAMLRMRQLLGGTHQAIYDHYQSRLFAPLGIRDAVIEPDASGTPVGGARGFLRPVDWLKLGQLFLNRGRWEATQVVPASFIDYLMAPSPASDGYGGSIWRRPNERHTTPEQRARLPENAIWMAGHTGQFLLIAPDEQLLILRMGVAMRKDIARHRVFELFIDLLETGNGNHHDAPRANDTGPRTEGVETRREQGAQAKP
ncbi:MAG: beta-lactamase family protein [Proteobacteria bacterium]|nr:beta-lactamase family protein [Pseudomonadota bacterium]